MVVVLLHRCGALARRPMRGWLCAERSWLASRVDGLERRDASVALDTGRHAVVLLRPGAVHAVVPRASMVRCSGEPWPPVIDVTGGLHRDAFVALEPLERYGL